MKLLKGRELPTRGTRPWLYLIVAAVVVLLDQLTKWLTVNYLESPGDSVDVIPGILRFTYIQNEGAAFGSLTDARWVFMVFSTVAIVGVLVYLLGFAENNRLLRWALAFVLGGGIGNMIDRTTLGFVVDMIDFCAFPSLWKWVFNVADSFVCIGMGMLVLYVLLAMRDELRAQKQKAASDNRDEGGES